uniref:Connector enhancer of kinase suppressor of Ras 1 n=1 Tax=Seriola lalandi dorsalis TaxID=1841481 RepID=A0A3B4WSJ5_SERLL
MEPITCWSEERVGEWLQGLDAPLHQYSVSEWHLSGLDLLQLTSQDLEKLGVRKIGHQELILEAVEKLCSLTYGMGGETLRGLTEKLRALAHTLQMGIQGRWRLNRSEGQSATKLPARVLQVVVELITSAKGLFSLLNRHQFLQLSGCTSTKNIFDYCRELGEIVQKSKPTSHQCKLCYNHQCRQLVAVCDEILNSSPEALLTHTAQLESVDLVPVSPGDQLGIEITSTGSSNHYVTGTAAEVGWSRANLVKKLQENPSGVTLVLKKIPGSTSEEEDEKDEEENPRHSIFERVAASVRSLSFRHVWVLNDKCQTLVSKQGTNTLLHCHSKTELTPGCHFLTGMSTAMSRRRVSCRELGRPDCDGWLWKKRKESSVFITQKWQRFWFVLKGPSLYWYTSQQDEKAEGLVNIASYSIESAGEHKRKYVFKMGHQRFQNFFFAVDNVSDMILCICILIYMVPSYHRVKTCVDFWTECYSETESESERSPSPRRRNKVKGVPEDEMGKMLNNIKEGGVSLIGHEQPFTHDHFRKSFIRRNKNPVINEKAHTLRALQSTLKAKEAELQQINKILEDSDLTASKYRQWKEQNEELIQEIEKLTALKASKGEDDAATQDTPAAEVALETVAKETATADTEGAYRLSLSDGEQLVDAEPSDVLLEIPQGSPDTETSPVLELSLGSLQDSINKQLSEMAESGEAAENYFYI